MITKTVKIEGLSTLMSLLLSGINIIGIGAASYYSISLGFGF